MTDDYKSKQGPRLSPPVEGCLRLACRVAALPA